MNRSEAINEIAGALAKAQRSIKNAVKDSDNPFFHSRYADLASVWDACREPLAENGLSVVQSPEYSADETNIVIVETMLIHSSGQWLSSTLKGIPVKEVNEYENGQKSAVKEVESRTPQAIGSCITYLRRYALAAFVGVAPEDDDANAASGKTDGAEEQTPKKSFDLASLKCPKCGRTGSIIKGKAEYGGGYVCWAKGDSKDHKKSCGAKFADNDVDLLKQMGQESPVEPPKEAPKAEAPKPEPAKEQPKAEKPKEAAKKETPKQEAKPQPAPTSAAQPAVEVSEAIPPKRLDRMAEIFSLSGTTDAHLASHLCRTIGIADEAAGLHKVDPKLLEAALNATLILARRHKLAARDIILDESKDEALVKEFEGLYKERAQ